jgi:hypothetical protein
MTPRHPQTLARKLKQADTAITKIAAEIGQLATKPARSAIPSATA